MHPSPYSELEWIFQMVRKRAYAVTQLKTLKGLPTVIPDPSAISPSSCQPSASAALSRAPRVPNPTGPWEAEADLHLHVEMGFLPLLPLLGLNPFLFL